MSFAAAPLPHKRSSGGEQIQPGETSLAVFEVLLEDISAPSR
jgi:hypothetical protein